VNRLQTYLDQLPDGWASHPDAQAKAGLFHAHQSDVTTPRTSLPTPLRELLDELPPVNMWVPDVLWVALGLAHADALFPDDDDAYLDDERRRAAQLMTRKTYQMLKLMTSPTMYLRSAPARWGSFHRGSTLEVVSSSKSDLQLNLQAPAGLFPKLFLQQVALTFEHMTAHTAEWAQVDLHDLRDDGAVFRFAWG